MIKAMDKHGENNAEKKKPSGTSTQHIWRYGRALFFRHWTMHSTDESAENSLYSWWLSELISYTNFQNRHHHTTATATAATAVLAFYISVKVFSHLANEALISKLFLFYRLVPFSMLLVVVIVVIRCAILWLVMSHYKLLSLAPHQYISVTLTDLFFDFIFIQKIPSVSRLCAPSFYYYYFSAYAFPRCYCCWYCRLKLMLTLPQPMFILKRRKNRYDNGAQNVSSISFPMGVLKLKATNNEEKAENEICFSHLSVYAIAFIRTTELQASLSMGEREKKSQIKVYLVHETQRNETWKKQRAQKHKQSRCTKAPGKKTTFKRRTKAQAKCTKYVSSFRICATFYFISRTIFT